MKRAGKIAVGIDVTETQVNMVMLRRTSTGCTVLNSATAPIPERAIEEGRIADPRQLAKALRAVKRRGMARAGSISVSLPIKETLTRIIPLVEQDPQRIGQFVRDELKQYAILSGQETASDFRVLTVARPDTPGSVLVAAADHENVVALATAGRLAGLQIGTIEPAATACARLFCMEKGSGSAEGNLLVVLFKEATLTLCVFRRGLLDFIRTDVLEQPGDGSDAIGRRIAEQVAAVMRFYTLRSSDVTKQWRVVLADDEHSSVLPPVLASLQASIDAGSVSLVTRDSLPQGLSIDLQGRRDLSLAALGLAMRSLQAGEDGSSVNLLPPEVSAARSAKKNMFVMANALAVVMLTVVVGTGALAYMGKRINQNIVAMKQEALRRNEHSLPAVMTEMAYIDQRMKVLSAEIKNLTTISDSHPAVDWVRFLDDVGNAVPPGVKLTELTSDGGAVATISGVARTSEAIRAFADTLNASGQVHHASVVRRERDKRSGGLIEYQIQCSLSTRKAP